MTLSRSADGRILLVSLALTLAMAAGGLVVLPGLTGAHPGTPVRGAASPVNRAAAGAPEAWMNLSSQLSTAPSPRSGAALAYDPIDQEMVLFGGASLGPGGALQPLGDTWVFKDNGWTNITSTLSISPPPRMGGKMVFDAADGYLVLFGAESPLDPYGPTTMNDTWSFVGGQWTQQANFPCAKFQYGLVTEMTYDAADGYVLLTGSTYGCPITSDFGSSWSYHGGTWTLQANSDPGLSPTDPMAYLSEDGYTVQFGGNDTYTPYKYLAGSWTQLCSASCSPSPPFEGEQPFVDDPAVGEGVMLEITPWAEWLPNFFPVLHGTSAWGYLSGTWGNLSPAAPDPSPRFVPSVAYDGSDGALMLFGGSTSPQGGFLNDTWELQSSVALLSANPSQITLGATTTLTTTVSGGVTPYTYAYAGLPPGCPAFTTNVGFCTPTAWGTYWINVTVTDQHGRVFFGQTELYVAAPADGWGTAVWSPLPTTGGGPTVALEAAVYDAADHYVLVYGGWHYNATWETWESDVQTWSFVNGTWTNLTSLSPTNPGQGPTRGTGEFVDPITYDAADGYVFLVEPGSGSQGVYAWTYLHGLWTNISATMSGDLPTNYCSAAMTYDPALGDVVFVEVPNCYGTENATTYLYHAGTWTLEPVSGPSPPLQPYDVPSITWDTADQSVFLLPAAAGGGTSFWTFHNGSWEDVGAPEGDAGGPSQVVGDPALRYVLDFGSIYAYNGNSTYLYAGGAWQEYPPSEPAPPDVFTGSNALVYVPTLGKVLSIGGMYEDSGMPTYPQVWSFGSSPPFTALQLSATPNPATIGEQVNFTTTVSGGIRPYAFGWSFGDGTTGGDLQNISHIFTTNGPFTTTVTVTDADGTVGHASVSIAITLTAQASGNVSAGALPLPVQFTSKVTGGVPAIAYSWRFGDGGTSPLPDPIHTYDSAGVFQAVLWANDSVGHSAEASWTVTVEPSNGPLTASLTASPSTVVVGGSSLLTLAISGGHGAYTIDWLDLPTWCSALTALTLRCTPDQLGTFVIEVTVSDASGSSVQATATLVVTSGSVPPGHSSSSSALSTLQWAALIGIPVALVLTVVAWIWLGRREAPRAGAPPSTEAKPSPSPSGGEKPPSEPGAQSAGLKS